MSEDWYGFAFDVGFDEDYVELFHDDIVSAGLEPVYEVGLYETEIGPHVLGEGATGTPPGEGARFAYPSLDAYLADFGPEHVYMRLKGRQTTEEGAFTYPVVEEFTPDEATIDYVPDQVDEMSEREERLREHGFDVTTMIQFNVGNAGLSDLVGEALGVSDASWEDPQSFLNMLVHTPTLEAVHPENGATFLVSYGEADGRPRITTTDEPLETTTYDLERQIRSILDD